MLILLRLKEEIKTGEMILYLHIRTYPFPCPSPPNTQNASTNDTEIPILRHQKAILTTQEIRFGIILYLCTYLLFLSSLSSS